MINAGVAAARGAVVVVLLNNDVAVLRADWLEALVRQACRPEVGAVGAKLLYADGTLQHAGVVVGLGGRAGHILRRSGRRHARAISAGCGSPTRSRPSPPPASPSRGSSYDAVGGLDAESLPDRLQRRRLLPAARRGRLQDVWTPRARPWPISNRSAAVRRSARHARRFEAEADRFAARWRDTIRHDPFYHPALSLTTFGEELE